MAKKETPLGVADSKPEAVGAFVALGTRPTPKGYEVVRVLVEGDKAEVTPLSNPLPRAAASERLRVETVRYMRTYL